MVNVDDLRLIIADLYEFYRLIVAKEFSNPVHAPHIERLAFELQRMYLGEYKRLAVAMPPRHSKSSMVTLAYPLWLIFNNPNLNILIINNSASLSEKFGIKLREFVKQYGREFHVHLSDVKHSSSYLMFEDDDGELCKGSIRLVGAGGSITGQDADVIIVDDPYMGFEDTTPSLLEKKIFWWKTLVEQRVEPHTKLILLHTRWKANDLQGYLKEHSSNKYKFLSFPAIKADGTPLWPEAYTLDILEDKREEMGEALFSAIFQQQPLDDQSDFFYLENLKYGRPKDIEEIRKARGWDIASSDNTKGNLNDYTAGLPMIQLADGKYLITDYVHGQFGNKTPNKIKQTAKLDGKGTKIIIETGVAAAGKLLYNEWKKQLAEYDVEQALPVTSKVDRATPLQNAILQGKIYIDIHDEELKTKLLSEFSSFPYGAHEDIVDAAAHAYNWLEHEEKKHTKKPDLQFINLRF